MLENIYLFYSPFIPLFVVVYSLPYTFRRLSVSLISFFRVITPLLLSANDLYFIQKSFAETDLSNKRTLRLTKGQINITRSSSLFGNYGHVHCFIATWGAH